MKNFFKKQKGITLIALVVTIIVLLILTGVTIATLSGENGILNRAQETNGINAYYSAEEQVRLAYMALKTEIMAEKTKDGTYDATKNSGKLAKIIKKDLSASEWSIKIGTKEVTTLTADNKEGSIINITYTNTAIKAGSIEANRPKQNGKVEYKIELTAKDATLGIDEDARSDSEEPGEEDPITPTQEGKSVTELKEGELVVYTDANEKKVDCKVLYGSDSNPNYGIQIIPIDLIKDINDQDVTVELGNETGNEAESKDEKHFATAKASYNTAIAKLNSAAQSYMNLSLSPSNGARCVGSSPNAPIVTNEDNTGSYINEYDYFSLYNSSFKPWEAKVSTPVSGDYRQMRANNCYSISKNYWYASRGGLSNYGNTFFSIRYMTDSGLINEGTWDKSLCRVTSNGITSHSFTYGLRPIFILKSDIYYVIKDGKNVLVP